MKKLILLLAILSCLSVPASAIEVTAPLVPESGEELMPKRAETFAQGLTELLQDAMKRLLPDLAQASKSCTAIAAIVLCVSILQSFSGSVRSTAELSGCIASATLLLGGTNSLVNLGTQTVTELSEYGKLLLPVMTTALAAQGGVTASTAIYAGTAVFDNVLCTLISRLMVPLVYLFLALAVANSAVGEELLKKSRDFIKWLMTWCLKIILYVFTGYMGITGVVSGTTDAAALKAAKITISGAVPVVGGILSDASEAVLVSAGLVKNTAGIYGILAILAVFLGPFLKIGAHYLMLKLTAAVCGLFGSKRITELIGDFSSAMGLVLAMTGSVCLLQLISAVCFLKGVA